MRNVDRFIDKQKKLRQYLRDELKWSQIKQKEYVNAYRTFASKFRINDMIMLDVRYLKIMRSNKSFDYKNFESFKVIRVINNCVYELKFFQTMNECFLVFHSWLLHLDDDNSMLDQQNTTSSSVATNINEDLWEIDEMLDSKIDKRRNDSTTRIKSCLRYRMRWTNRNNLNITFDWYIYIDLKTTSYLMIDFHYKYSKKNDFHAFFVRFENWISSNH